MWVNDGTLRVVNERGAMPPRTTPTARQLRLGVELRKLREHAGLTATDAAALLGTERTKISNIETGRFGVSAARVRRLASHYDCSDTNLIEALADMTGERKRQWWEVYREILPAALLDLAELEHHASALRSAQFMHLPGLLQTHDHARVVFQQVVPSLPPPEVEHRVSHRVKRQAVLFRESPPAYTAVIHEAALRMRFGGRSTTRTQLQHILNMSEHDHISVLVVPFAAGAIPGSGQSVLYAAGPIPQLDTVQLDSEHGSVFLDADAQLARYRIFMDRTEKAALKEDESRDFIRAIAQDL